MAHLLPQKGWAKRYPHAYIARCLTAYVRYNTVYIKVESNSITKIIEKNTMSAFIMSRDAYSTVYSGLKVFGMSQLPSCEIIKRASRQVFDNAQVKSTDAAEDAITMFYAANVNAVNQRYGDDTSPGIPFHPQFNPHVSMFQFLKSLECLHYQMSEGDVPTTDAYSLLKQLIDAVYYQIVSNTPDYQSARWD